MGRKVVAGSSSLFYGHSSFDWPVVPLCERQLRDVNPSDILNDGLYRRCDIYKGGGGYDQFEAIYHRRFGGSEKLNEQFVVQLRGCPLRCPYCYVTGDGIWGEPVKVSTKKMVADFEESGFPVFHLMGGAPALYISWWPDILDALPGSAVFHSDFLLQELEYPVAVLKKLADHKRNLHAVSIKGCDAEEFKKNTGVGLNEPMLWKNLDNLVDTGVQFYLTFTGMPRGSVDKFSEVAVKRYGGAILKDSFAIDIVEYDALK